jgi:hypothetical protein
LPRRGAETVPTSGAVWELLRGTQSFGPMMAAATEASGRAHAFHWPLEFPDLMAKGGFDVVLGNPPWERIKLQEQEFFAARSPEIAGAPNKAAREKLIKALAAAPRDSTERALFETFITAKREAEATSEFFRVPGGEGGRFALTGRGDVNTYALFAEFFSRLTGPRGRAGVIVPTGIATDDTTSVFFSSLIESGCLARLISFENEEFIFPAVHHSYRFCLLTMSSDRERAPGFAFFLRKPEALSDPERNFTLTPEGIAAINPNTHTAPVFRSRADAELTARIYARVPVLTDETKGASGNPWGVTFARLFDMSNDSDLFRTAAQLEAAGYARYGTDWLAEAVRPPRSAMTLAGGRDALHLGILGGRPRGLARYLPLYEAKMIHQFDHRWATYGGPDNRDVTEVEKGDPAFEPTPRYWVSATEVEDRLARKGWTRGWLMGWRDICRSHDQRTVIFGLMPRVGVGHTSPLVFLDAAPAHWAALYANLDSLALDYVARQAIGGSHLTYSYLKQFAVLAPDFYTDARLAFIVPRVLELTYTSHAMAPFARDLGYDGSPFAWDEDRRAHLRANLDAFYARAYGLDRDELRYILDPRDVKGPDYPSETFRVLKEKEIRQYGEYRTRRLVLEAWDRMEADGTFVALGLGADQATVPAPAVQMPTPATLPDGAWIGATQQPNDAGAALTAILKAIDRPIPSGTFRLAAAMMMVPRLLTSLLPEARAREWRRLVGPDAEPLTGNVVGFSARTNPGWGAAVSNHRGNGRLIEDPSAGTWAPGPGLDAFDTAGWPDGRARFVLEALTALDLDKTVTAMPDEVRDWIAHAAAA